MSADAVIYEKQAGVATITKNNPPQYGMTLDVLTGMKRALVDANNDEDIQVIVITAGGPGFHMGGGWYSAKPTPIGNSPPSNSKKRFSQG